MNKKAIILLSTVDVKINIIKKFYLYIPVILITFFYCISAYNRYNFYYNINELNSEMSLGNYLFYLWEGAEIFSKDSSNNVIKIPAFITFFFLYNGFLICRYLTIKRSFSMGNFYLNGLSNFNWHISKMMWTTINTILYFGVFFIFIIVFSIFFGNASLDTSEDVIYCFSHTDFPTLLSNFGSFVMMPFLILISTAFIQIFLSLILSPIIAYTIIVIYYVLSLFFCKSYFIYNYVILLRLDLYNSYGISYYSGIILNVTLIILIFISYVLLSKKKEKFIK